VVREQQQPTKETSRMKPTTYQTIKALQQSGWELITLTEYKSKHNERPTWHAILTQDGISMTVQIEDEALLWMSDIKRECPKCGRLYDEEKDCCDADCPDCEIPWIWKKEIPEDF
jgi:hypothetical protein